MSVYAGPEIANDGLVFAVDSSNSKSYSGNTFYDLITGSVLGNPDWANGATALSCICSITIDGSDTGYAYHPVNKWPGTATASFVLYHFQNFNGNSVETNNLRWYANRGGTWGTISGVYKTSPGNTYVVGLQYDSITGGQLWINGAKVGSRNGSGILGTNSSNIVIDGNVTGRSGIHKVNYVSFYNRELADSEITQNFNALRGRYGI